jgi:transcription-repair coupling factor (superfamily II helicase)
VELADFARVRLDRVYPRSVVKQAVDSILVPRPKVGGIGGQVLRDVAVLDWAGGVIDDVVSPSLAVKSSSPVSSQ